MGRRITLASHSTFECLGIEGWPLGLNFGTLGVHVWYMGVNFLPLGVFCVNFRQLRFDCELQGVNDLL